MKPSILRKVFSSAVLLFPVVADALEMPQPKLGLWEIRVQMANDGAAPTALPTTQVCLNAAAMETAKMGEEMVKKMCSKMEVHKDGSKWITNSICKIGGSTVSGLTTTEFNGENAYHIDINSTYNPPMGGHSRDHMVRDGKWLGPCK